MPEGLQPPGGQFRTFRQACTEKRQTSESSLMQAVISCLKENYFTQGDNNDSQN